ncbi:hypothetical protein M3Y99_00324400 [Aphelenchoides fujianensis]|nr:hypothetical protein M3Y99_00324400 [Aphelenchoides fujianensis]
MRTGPHFSKPIVAEVQQGNTAAVHDVLNIAITKTAAGFQFGFAGRFSTEGTIFLITHVNPSGPSADLLKSGDRLLKIGPTDVTHLEQHEVTQLLRNCEIGDQIEFQISRTPEVHEEANETPVKAGDTSTSQSSQIRGLNTADRILELRVPVNETAAAGLGLVLKGRSSELDDAEQGAGVYIDRILQGSAAYKDGRLREGDRLLGIENFCLLRFARNSDAAHAFHRYVAELSPSCAYFRVFISRAGSPGYEPNEISRTVFTRWMNAAQKRKFLLLFSPLIYAPFSALNASRNQDVVDSSAVQTPEEVADARMVVPSSPMADETASVTSVPVEPFNRESATRRSFSEKGPTKMRVDPSQFENFRRIAHQRQVSAPAIGHRRHRTAELQRQRSAGLIKRLEPKASSPPAAPLPKSSFSLRTFFGRRSARKEAAKKANGQPADVANLPDKENHNADAQQLETKRRSMSGEPQKSDQFRYSSRSHENVEPAQNMSPSTTAARDLSRKKRRSVGNSVLKFFQRADPSPQLGRKHDQESPSGGRADQFKPTAGPPMYARPIAHVHHRRFGSAHEGFQHEPVGVYNWGRAVDPRNSPRPVRPPERRTEVPQPPIPPPRRPRTASLPQGDYYGAFNQWFAGTTAPYAGADPHRQQRFGADYWNNAVVPVHYAPTYAPAFAAAAPVEGDLRAASNWCAPGGVYEFNRLAAVTSSLSRSPRLAHSYDTTIERL